MPVTKVESNLKWICSQRQQPPVTWRLSLCPLKRQMEWKHERGTTFLSRFAKQNLKNLFKSQPTLIFAIDVCLRGGPSHLETAQIKYHGPKGWVRSSPQQAPAGLWMWGARGHELKYGGTAAGAYAHHRGPGIASLYTISKPRQASELKWF